MPQHAYDPAMGLQLERCNGNLGAFVSGVDLAGDLDDATIAELEQALVDNLVLFFRDQPMSPAQHVALGRRFGELHVHPLAPNLGPAHPEIIALDTSNNRNPVEWHSDATFEECPPLGSILHAIEVPPLGGDTVWASMYAAYDALSDTMKTLLDPLYAVHDSSMTFGPGGRNKTFTLDASKTAQRRVEHPVVRTHPVSGRKSLFVNFQFTSHIDGMTARESRALLDFLLQHVTQATFQVRLSWQPHTVAMWDNRCTQHYVTADYTGTGRRYMHRVTVLGDRPV
jgi:taurine dioxygenase